MKIRRENQMISGSTKVILACGLLLTGLSLAVADPLISIFNSNTAPDQPLPGVTLGEALPPQKGVVITSVKSLSEAERLGLRAGNRIVAIDHVPVASPSQVERLIRDNHNKTLMLNIDGIRKSRAIELHRTSGV